MENDITTAIQSCNAHAVRERALKEHVLRTEALEVAQRLCDRPFGHLDMRTFYELREGLKALGMWPVAA